MGNSLRSACVEFDGRKNDQGYGIQWFQGRQLRAHRVAFFLEHGYWPRVCRHRCDNPSCINADHLLDGTIADNSRDMVNRGRASRKGAKVTVEQVRCIKWLVKHGYRQCEVAAAYGLSRQRVHQLTRDH